MSKGKRKLVIKVGNSIYRGDHLKVTVRELYGKTITVIVSELGGVNIDNNPHLIKYFKDPTTARGKCVLVASEYEIILEKPLGGSNA